MLRLFTSSSSSFSSLRSPLRWASVVFSSSPPTSFASFSSSSTAWHLVRGDRVHIVAGRDRGKEGVIVKVLRDRDAVIVEGLNLVKKHIKSTRENRGGVITKEMPIHRSNVALLDPTTGAPTRVRMMFKENGDKVRVGVESGAIIERPALLRERRYPTSPRGERDTPLDVAMRVTATPSS
eukprot:EC686893.1.p1 GENE.EC686893.1~~EC686893.1.p1  ORF type:complete len:180 (+),score=78.34 EC686893.1:135-674(+)